MRTGWLFWSGVISAVLMLGVLGYAYTLHGFDGFLHVNGVARIAYIALVSLAGMLLLLTLFEARLLALKTRKAAFLSLAVRLLTAGALVFVLGSVWYVGDHFDRLTDTAPRLMLAEGTQTSGVPNIVVVFNTASPSINSIRWGNNSSLIGKATETTEATSHTFILSALQPATEYWYRVNFGKVYTFRTPDLTGSLKIAIVSDAHFGRKSNPVGEMASMLSTIADTENGYDMLFSLGDLTDFGFRDRQWKEAFEALDPAAALIPTVLLPGNHDTLITGVNKFKAYAYPEGMPLENGTQLWHRFDNGNVHFLVLDVEWSAEVFTPAQRSWLEAELQTIPRSDWTIVMSHGFYYSSGYVSEGWQWYDNQETIGAITPIFEKYGVDMVFSGHNHQMELLEQNGVMYVVGGVFGGKLDPERTYTSPASVWFSVQEHGFVAVEINGDTADIYFTNAGGDILYHRTINNR